MFYWNSAKETNSILSGLSSYCTQSYVMGDVCRPMEVNHNSNVPENEYIYIFKFPAVLSYTKWDAIAFFMYI